jgi:hypothetical protein
MGCCDNGLCVPLPAAGWRSELGTRLNLNRSDERQNRVRSPTAVAAGRCAAGGPAPAPEGRFRNARANSGNRSDAPLFEWY